MLLFASGKVPRFLSYFFFCLFSSTQHFSFPTTTSSPCRPLASAPFNGWTSAHVALICPCFSEDKNSLWWCRWSLVSKRVRRQICAASSELPNYVPLSSPLYDNWREREEKQFTGNSLQDGIPAEITGCYFKWELSFFSPPSLLLFRTTNAICFYPQQPPPITVWLITPAILSERHMENTLGRLQQMRRNASDNFSIGITAILLHLVSGPCGLFRRWWWQRWWWCSSHQQMRRVGRRSTVIEWERER